MQTLSRDASQSELFWAMLFHTQMQARALCVSQYGHGPTERIKSHRPKGAIGAGQLWCQCCGFVAPVSEAGLMPQKGPQAWYEPVLESALMFHRPCDVYGLAVKCSKCNGLTWYPRKLLRYGYRYAKHGTFLGGKGERRGIQRQSGG